MKKIVNNVKSKYLALCQEVGAFKIAPSKAQVQMVLFVLGVTLLTVGMAKGVIAQTGNDFEAVDEGLSYNDSRLNGAIAGVLTYIEGSFGALIMVGSGIAAIISSAFGQYRAALGCLVVAVGAFILRSVMSTFFNLSSAQGLDNDA